ncbi:tRNA uridine(34) 5-carboxymethylaminomethyl modification radical SAM/GNAT enzyme Elp3 [Candidatus Peregrinibacteria bacterium]|nr:tRNA uridine(34) 5-carboxymethylaminomethyl modification radical SAM/GNAT enzyme Elp3 [Candidatus Peregrinibacteria bacterium]
MESLISPNKANTGEYRDFLEKVHRELLIKAYSSSISNHRELQDLKNEISLKYKVPSASNVELLKVYRQLIDTKEMPDDKDFLKLLRKRSVRSQSGIANITVLTKAYPCPGKCIFCPTEPAMPKSYLSNEPAMMRAILNNFDAYKQTKNRIESLHKTGHHTDKVDVIVSGGTFSFYPKRYQTDFTRGIYNALNYPNPPSRSLEKAQKINETAKNRCIGLSFETRPDHINPAELRRLRRLGCTKIEIGVQSLNDKVLELNRRGHGIAETKHAIKLIRDAAYKINVHMMPNLLGSTPEIDLADMKELFDNPAYRPDWMKVYPCMVVPWSQLEGIYKKGLYSSYTDESLIELMVEMTKTWPEYVRVTRMYRDIPANTIVSGSKISNLRQVVEERMAKRGIVSRDIRSREIKDGKVNFEDLNLNVLPFEASDGQEFFVSYDHPKLDKLCALLRLRFSSYSLSGKKHFMPELDGAALVREVHTYGEQVKIANREGEVSQHIGLGRRMMMEAERISKQNGYKKLAVIAGIGVREYYKKLGYQLEGTYMVKYL